ncbi:MAG: UPF0280 family protein [Candidatus Syntrophonatronum acetioxidans]|uniref:UPF0280 family protein n=1 Tax=Candidatus Syntrophonatronum acetioxidans TaxID=1795816 RepID=A0A424Y9I0_9FIRM|nr:MAG: UPF0280 family protein [Candidatus Syntrophonatronum acetioxidans]
MPYDIRTYRRQKQDKDLHSFTATVKDTDLWIGVDSKSYRPDFKKRVEDLVWRERRVLEGFITREPEFKASLEPYLLPPQAPNLAVIMARAGNQVGVGPMAAVAGAFAELVGKEMMKLTGEVIVENGGDVFLKIKKKRKISIYVGDSPFSNRLALEIRPSETPLGVCTSSGIVGPSYSKGKAHGVVVLSPSTPLADAAATYLGNLIIKREDVEKTLEESRKISGIKGVLIIKDDKLGAWGRIRLVSP